jgi:hypothetical protein
LSRPAQPLSIVLLSLSITFLAVLCLGVALYARSKIRERRKKDGWELMPRFEKGVSWREGDAHGDMLTDARELEEYDVVLAKKRAGKLRRRSLDGAEAERVTPTANPWARPPTLVNTFRRGDTHLIDLSEPTKKDVLAKRDSWGGEAWDEGGWGDDGEGDVALSELRHRKDGWKGETPITRTEGLSEGPLVDLSDQTNPKPAEHQHHVRPDEEEDVVEETHSRRTSVATLVDVGESDCDPLPLVDISPKTISKLPLKLSNLLVLMDGAPDPIKDTDGGEDVLVDTSVPVSPLLVVTPSLLSGGTSAEKAIDIVPEYPEKDINWQTDIIATTAEDEYALYIGTQDGVPEAIVEVDTEANGRHDFFNKEALLEPTIEFDDETNTTHLIVESDDSEDILELSTSKTDDDTMNLNVLPTRVLNPTVVDDEKSTDHDNDAAQEGKLLDDDRANSSDLRLLREVDNSATAIEEEEDDDFHDATALPPVLPSLLISPPTDNDYDHHDDDFRDALSSTPFITPSHTPDSPISPLPDIADIHVSPLSTPTQALYKLRQVVHPDPPLPGFHDMILPPTLDTLVAPDPDDIPLPEMPLPTSSKPSMRRSPLQGRDLNVNGTLPAWSVRAIDSPALGVATALKGNNSSPSSPVCSETSDGVETPKASSSPLSKAEGSTSEPSSPSESTDPSAPDPPSPTTEVAPAPKQPRAYLAFPQFDIALAMQLRPGLGIGADPAWMVRFLMSMFGWFAVMLTSQVRRRESSVR